MHVYLFVEASTREDRMPQSKVRLFQIQNDGNNFFTGVCDGGRQVVMGLLCPEIVAFFFNTAGDLIEQQARPWSEAAAQLAGRELPYKIFGGQFRALIQQQMQAWQAELRFRTKTIQVKEFSGSPYSVGIELLPDQWIDLEDAEELDDEEREEEIQARDQWLAKGQFVFWWSEDYHMSKSGRVLSS
jgi:hypothetical protein